MRCFLSRFSSRHRRLFLLSGLCTLIATRHLQNNQEFLLTWTSPHHSGNHASAHRAARSNITHTATQPRQHKVTETTTSPKADEGSGGSVRGAYFSNGTIGYVADPWAVKRGISSFLRRESHDTSKPNEHPFWKLIATFESSADDILPYQEEVCRMSPGSGPEGPNGWTLLTQKIRIPDSSRTRDDGRTKISLLCVVYSHSGQRHMSRMAALTWGHHCDGFLSFSNETLSSLGIVHLQHDGPESYFNMWQKVRSMLAYISQHYSNQFDFVHIGGDDVYLIVQNLRLFLQRKQEQHGNRPMYWGQWIQQKSAPYVGGGPGYTINRAALNLFVQRALPTCFPDKEVSYEDRLFSQCMQWVLGVMPGDTREEITGEQRYHEVSPESLSTSRVESTSKRRNFHQRNMAYWATLPQPNHYPDGVWRPTNEMNGNLSLVGLKMELASAAKDSISFHKIHTAVYMARIHAILYPELCQTDGWNTTV